MKNYFLSQGIGMVIVLAIIAVMLGKAEGPASLDMWIIACICFGLLVLWTLLCFYLGLRPGRKWGSNGN